MPTPLASYFTTKWRNWWDWKCHKSIASLLRTAFIPVCWLPLKNIAKTMKVYSIESNPNSTVCSMPYFNTFPQYNSSPLAHKNSKQTYAQLKDCTNLAYVWGSTWSLTIMIDFNWSGKVMVILVMFWFRLNYRSRLEMLKIGMRLVLSLVLMFLLIIKGRCTMLTTKLLLIIWDSTLKELSNFLNRPINPFNKILHKPNNNSTTTHNSTNFSLSSNSTPNTS